MSIVSEPNITAVVRPAIGTISSSPQRVLFVGQMIAAGTATTGVLVENIGNSGEEDALFGATSMIAQMVRQAKTINQITQFDAIPLDDAGGGVAATGTVVFTGTATAAGTIVLKIGSGNNYSMDIAIAVGDTETDVGDAVDAAVLLLISAPFSSSNAAGTVTFTCANKGTIGNNFGYKVEGAVAGITTALTVPVNGATDPTLTGIFSVIDGERYQTIVWPGGYALTALTTELDSRFDSTNAILDGVGIQTIMDTFGNIQTAANAENSKSLVLFGNKILTDAAHKGGALLEFDDVISSKFAAIRALRLTDDAVISQYVIGGSNDQFGGVHLSSKPYFNTPFANMDLIGVGKGFSATEIGQLKTAGASHLGNNVTRTTILSDEIVTTRKTDTAGNAETTFKYLNAVDTSVAVRKYFVDNLRATYAQSRLTEGDLQPNHSMENQASIEAFVDKLYNDMSGEGFVLTQSGQDAITFFKNNRTVTLTMATGLVTIVMTVPIVGQLRTIQMTINITFSTTG